MAQPNLDADAFMAAFNARLALSPGEVQEAREDIVAMCRCEGGMVWMECVNRVSPSDPPPLPPTLPLCECVKASSTLLSRTQVTPGLQLV